MTHTQKTIQLGALGGEGMVPPGLRRPDRLCGHLGLYPWGELSCAVAHGALGSGVARPFLTPALQEERGEHVLLLRTGPDPQ